MPSPAPHTDRVLIVDFGSQVTQLIAQRVRKSGVYCEIHPFNTVTEAFLAEFGARAVILSGGPASVTKGETPRATDALFAMAVPMWGVTQSNRKVSVKSSITPSAACMLSSAM